MKLALLVGTTALLFISPAMARSSAEIKKNKTLRIGLRERDLVYAKGQKLMHTRVAEIFTDHLSRSLGVPLEVQFRVASDMTQFWADSAGKVRQGAEYTPDFFKEVDVYADVLTVNGWRQKLAEPIPFLPIKESFLCNFKASQMTFEKIRGDRVRLYTVRDSSFHTLVRKANFKENEIHFVKDTPQIIPALEREKAKACTVLDSDFALFKAKTMKLTFAGPANDTSQALAWWVAKGDRELLTSLRDFWSEFRNTEKWKSIFKESYGMEYTEYLNVVGNL